ncbi:MAG: hypothetical protein V4760_12530 [Bdellovibrionota bacterium]
MLKRNLLALLTALLVVPTFPVASIAAPIDDSVEGDFQDESAIDDELVKEELGPDEEPPPAEYPYPGAIDKNLQASPESTMPGVSFAAERPKKIDEETGTYFYDKDTVTPTFSGRSDVPAPRSATKSGEFIYDTKSAPAPYIGAKDREAPVEMRDNGEYFYAVENSPERGSFSFRLGFIEPPTLSNAQTGAKFSEIYEVESAPILLLDYESKITGKIGRIGLKFGSGLYTAQGVGQFMSTTTTRRPDDVPEERYTFMLFPNSLTAVYRFQYSDKQIFVPFIEGGIGYFGFMELRDDNITPKLGGAGVSIAAAGANFNLDWLDRRSIRALDNEYGVNHVWLTTEFRVLVGLNKTYDFSSNVFNAGILLEF